MAHQRRLMTFAVALFVGALGCGSLQGTRAAPQGASPAPSDHASVAENMLDADFADPFVLRDTDAYYAFATGSTRLHLQVARSRDLVAWTHLGEALPDLPPWALDVHGFTWAPSALARSSRYILYYTTRDALSGFQCISRALSPKPEGPYRDESREPLVCQIGPEAPYCGSIDPSPFLDSDGKLYLLWKSDENSSHCRTAPRVWAQPLTDDGLQLVGLAKTLIAVDQRWEHDIIEAPSMMLREGRYFLFYSGNWYESGNYAIGYATCPNLLGGCTKVTLTAPYLMSAGSMLGPGGQELFEDASGATWMAYHAWTAPKTTYRSGGARSLRLARLTFGADGQPAQMIMP
jgi:beta-xylosidase